MTGNLDFWLVWNPKTGYTMFRHESKEGARAEAERLAIAHPGDTFIVLTPHSACKRTDVQWQERQNAPHDDGIPF